MAEGVAQAASVAQSVLGFKGNRALAKQARQLGEFQAKVEENNLVLTQRARAQQEASVRASAERLRGIQRTATAKSGVQMSGSPLQAMADTYFSTERDAQRVQYAASVEAARSAGAAAMRRLEGESRAAGANIAALQSLLGGASDLASVQQNQRLYDLQVSSYERDLGSAKTTP